MAEERTQRIRMKDKTERKSMRETEKGRKGVRERERWRGRETGIH